MEEPCGLQSMGPQRWMRLERLSTCCREPVLAPAQTGSWSRPGSARALRRAQSPYMGIAAWGPPSLLRNGDGEASDSCL